MINFEDKEILLTSGDSDCIEFWVTNYKHEALELGTFYKLKKFIQLLLLQ
jgi:hypothetical protein